MLANATRICEAEFGTMYRYENDAFYPAATLNAPSPYADFIWTRGRFLPQSGNALDLLLQTKQVIRSVDQSKERVPNSVRQTWGSAVASDRAYAQGRQFGRRDRHLPPGGTSVHR